MVVSKDGRRQHEGVVRRNLNAPQNVEYYVGVNATLQKKQDVEKFQLEQEKLIEQKEAEARGDEVEGSDRVEIDNYRGTQDEPGLQ